MRVHVPDVFLSFEFQKDRKKMWELWGRNFPSPIEKAHRLYNYNSLLLATAQAVIYQCQKPEEIGLNNRY